MGPCMSSPASAPSEASAASEAAVPSQLPSSPPSASTAISYAAAAASSPAGKEVIEKVTTAVKEAVGGAKEAAEDVVPSTPPVEVVPPLEVVEEAVEEEAVEEEAVEEEAVEEAEVPGPDTAPAEGSGTAMERLVLYLAHISGQVSSTHVPSNLVYCTQLFVSLGTCGVPWRWSPLALRPKCALPFFFTIIIVHPCAHT